jgi:hypothetical protein
MYALEMNAVELLASILFHGEHIKEHFRMRVLDNFTFATFSFIHMDSTTSSGSPPTPPSAAPHLAWLVDAWTKRWLGTV